MAACLIRSGSSAAVLGAALVALCGMSPSGRQLPSSDTFAAAPCSIAVVRRAPVVLGDTVGLARSCERGRERVAGRLAWNSVTGMATGASFRSRSNETGLAPGRRYASIGISSPTISDSAIGAIVGRDGKDTLVRNPRPSVRWSSLHAARASAQRWHVILTTGTSDSTNLLLGGGDARQLLRTRGILRQGAPVLREITRT